MDVLDNLVKAKQLNLEPFNRAEFIDMVAAATVKLRDVQLQGLSPNMKGISTSMCNL